MSFDGWTRGPWLKHPIKMHNHHDIFYVVIAIILLDNMMVEVCMGQGEVESYESYNLFSKTKSQSNITEVGCGEGEFSECENLGEIKDHTEEVKGDL